MNCPRCTASVMTEMVRDGVTVDVCATCRGVWLDRGELEKLIAASMRELDDEAPAPTRGSRNRKRDQADDHDDEDRYVDDDPRRAPGMPPRKRRWFDMFGDILD